MQLLRLQLTNFRQHEATEIHFEPGLTGIVGVNGAGKTTLLEAIAYALYGVNAARGTRETMRRRGAPARSRFEVELDFALGPHRYRLTRGFTQAELIQDGQTIANSTGAVTDRIVALLGMNRDEFFNTYFTGQKELAVMAAMGPTERAQFLSRVLGYEKLREAQELLRTRRSNLRSQLVGIEQGLGDAGLLEAELVAATVSLEEATAAQVAATATEKTALDQLGTLRPEFDAALLRRTSWQTLDAERRIAEREAAAARAALEGLGRELSAGLGAQVRVIELEDHLKVWSDLIAERALLDEAAIQWNSRSRSAARRDQLRQRISELTVEIASLPSADAAAALVAERETAVKAREASEHQVEERRTRWTQDKQESETRLEQFRDRYRELKDQRELIQNGGPEGICPTCGRPLGKDFQTMLDLLDRQLEEVSIDGQYLRQRTDQLKDAPAELHDLEEVRQKWERELRRLTETQGQVQAQLRHRAGVEQELTRLQSDLLTAESELSGPAASYDVERHTAVRHQLETLEPLRREYDQLIGIAARTDQMIAEAALVQRRVSEHDANLQALDQRILQVDWQPARFEELESQLRTLEGERQRASVQVADAAARADSAGRVRAGVLMRQAERAERAALARRLGEEIALLHELDRAFTDLRTELNLQMRPDLADHASRLLHQLTGGRYDDLELDESYVPTVIDDGEVKPVLSGGEEDIVNLALRLAISQMIADRAGQPLSLLVLDEIFGSLDDERRGSVLTLLRALSDRFPQVILITHVEGMRDAFDRVIRMTYNLETGVTTAQDETPSLANAAA